MTAYLIKLVRGRIPDVVPSSKIAYKPMAREQHVEALRKKLIEESAEYCVKPGVEELADVLETVWTLADIDLGVGCPALREVGAQKLTERGGFAAGIGMYAVETTEAQT